VTIDGLVFVITAIVATLLIIFVLVMVHEAGHFFTARLARIRVLEFGIGFPPRARVLARRGDVDYTLNWLPIGGFVRMEGEEQDSDDPRSFNNAGLPRQLLVLVAGVTMNVILAFLLFFVVAWFFGPAESVSDVYVLDGGAAQAAGLHSGITIESLNGQHYGFMSSEDILQAIREHAGQAVTLGYIDTDGSHKTIDLTLGPDPSKGVLGIGCAPVITSNTTCSFKLVVTYLPTNPGAAAVTAWDQTVNSLQVIGRTLGDLVGQAASNPGAAPAGVAGPVGIVQAVGIVLTDYGPVILILLAGLLSANLALINVLPIPPFDGGKMVIMVIKRAFGVRAVTNYEIATNLIGFALLIAFVLWISYFDVVRIGSGG
jgi:regulator of sigma E protease